MFSRSCIKFHTFSARFSRSISLSSKHNGWKEKYESYIRFPNLLLSQQNVIKASEEYSLARSSREQSVGGLIAEQNRLRDIHSEMDMLPSFHPTYSTLLQSELDALNNMHARLFDVNLHDRSDHQQYLHLCTALQQNLEAERQSERRARRVFFGAILLGLGCGVLLAWGFTQSSELLQHSHTGDSLLSPYGRASNVEELKHWINKQHSKVSAFLLEVANEFEIERGGETVELGGVEGVAEMAQRNKGVQEEMRLVTEAIRRQSLPVLEVREGGRGEKGLWMTTLGYSCMAIFVPLLACLIS